MKARKGALGASSKGRDSIVVKESLNPEREEEDNKQFTVAMQDNTLRQELETAWVICLRYGEPLKKSKCPAKNVLRYTIETGFANTDRNTNVVQRSMDLFLDEEGFIHFDGFVKTLFYMGMERFPHLKTDYQQALQQVHAQFIRPHIFRHIASQESDGSEPDEKLLSIPEIDRLLYVYDAPLGRIFNRYKDFDRHHNRELTLDQNKLLDNFMEVEEMKEMLKDAGYFPRLVAYSDISRCCQYACFGKIVVDPTRQGGARFSSIDAKKDMKDVGPMDVLEASAFVKPSDLGAEAANPLYVPLLPKEFLTDEALLDKARFMSALVRLSQVIYARMSPASPGASAAMASASAFLPEPSMGAIASDQSISNTAIPVVRFPTKASRFEALLEDIEGYYEKMFQKAITSECDYTERGLPVISSGHACTPDHGPMSGFELSIAGNNFCEKRGVFARFSVGSETALVVRSKEIQKRKIIVDAPAMTPSDVEVQVDFRHGEYDVFLNRITRARVECSNNRWDYSKTEPAQMVTFRMTLPPVAVDVDTTSRLMKLFGSVCAMGDSMNTKLLSKAKWKTLKEHCELSEAPKGTNSDNEAFFLEVAEFHDGIHDLSLNFKGFMRVLVRTLVEMVGDGWVDALQIVSEKRFEAQKRVGAEDGTKADQSDVALARRAIAAVERRSDVQVDIMLGPIRVGVLCSRPGDVSTITSGRSVVIMKHPALSYVHHEVNSERVVLANITASLSVPHLLRRLLHHGFDVCAHNPNQNARKPAGRCWAVHNADGERVGALWDSPGNYSCIEWQPAVQEMANTKFSMCCYKEEKTMDFVICYIQFSKAKDAAEVRNALIQRGYTLTTTLYRIP